MEDGPAKQTLRGPYASSLFVRSFIMLALAAALKVLADTRSRWCASPKVRRIFAPLRPPAISNAYNMLMSGFEV